MRLDNKDVSIALVGAGFILLLVYLARTRSNTGQPRYESAGGSATTASVFGVVDSLDTGSHYFHPAYCVPGQTQIFTPHKYPDLCGGNISTLFHYGFDALNKPAPQDNDWIKYPPAEVQF
jgi:hypothetical protein